MKNLMHDGLLLMILISFFILHGCGGASSSLIPEEELSEQGWIQYRLDFNVYEDEDGTGSIEKAYKEGFIIGFNDEMCSNYKIRTEQERLAFETGYCDGVFNRTGDY